MRIIYKYSVPHPTILPSTMDPLKISGALKPLMLGVDPQRRTCVWIEHDEPDDSPRDVWLITVGTGHLIPDGATHMGSYVDGPFVWHVYATGERP